MAYMRLAKIAEVLEGRVLSIETRYVRVGLTRLKGEIIAFEDICSHDGEMISSGRISDGEIICPRHHARFDLKTGAALCMPATLPIATFKVKLSGEDVEVELDE
jgi:3-phenylpropionate/trans-cinnamate dioxygenase ferredoxin component